MTTPSQTLGKYRILEELGRGGFATVYRAEDTTLGREVALKILHPQLLTDPGWVERFHREARAIAQLRHPHIVTIYEIGEAEGRLYIAMDLISTGSVAERLERDGPFSWDETLALLRQVSDALDYAHGEGILHRDLKPANILLDLRTGAVLTDFGFAKLVGESSMSLSLSGGVMGTPAYIAPELWDGHDPLPQSDVYALGCVVYELLTGARLFEGKTPSVVMRKHLIDGPQLPTTWPENIPPGLVAVLSKALAREPEARYASAGELLMALVSIAPEATAKAITTSQEIRSSDFSRVPIASPKRGFPVWGWGLVAVMGLLMVIYLAILLPRLLEKPTSKPTGVVSAATATWTPTTSVATLVPTSTSVPTDTPSLQPLTLGATRVREADSMTMIYVPAGEFRMGSVSADNMAVASEMPARNVFLDAFWIDRVEVSVGQYRQCVQAGICNPPQRADSVTRPNYYTDSTFANYPVLWVTWHDASVYCNWVGARLPTEAEWEKAARGTEGRIYPWGNTWEAARANAVERLGDTQPVGSFPSGASPYGVLDMSGNVWEWINDWFSEDYYQRASSVNPSGPTTGTQRSVRGGSWYSRIAWQRAAYRGAANPDFSDDDIGFRCAVSATVLP